MPRFDFWRVIEMKNVRLKIQNFFLWWLYIIFAYLHDRLIYGNYRQSYSRVIGNKNPEFSASIFFLDYSSKIRSGLCITVLEKKLNLKKVTGGLSQEYGPCLKNQILATYHFSPWAGLGAVWAGLVHYRRRFSISICSETLHQIHVGYF